MLGNGVGLYSTLATHQVLHIILKITDLYTFVINNKYQQTFWTF